MSRWGKPRKNKKFIDPRYFMDEKTLQEGYALGVEWNTDEAKEHVARLLDTDVDQIIKWEPKERGTGVFASEGTEVILDDATLWPGRGTLKNSDESFRAVMVKHHQMPDGGTHWTDQREFWINNSPPTSDY